MTEDRDTSEATLGERALADLLRWLQDDLRRLPLRELLQPTSKALEQSPEAVVQGLRSPHEADRCIAIRSLVDRWEFTEEMIGEWAGLATSDRSAVVRGAALWALLRRQGKALLDNERIPLPIRAMVSQFLATECDELDEADRELLEEADELEAQCDATLEEVERDWQQLGGPRYSEMLTSSIAAIQSLQDSSRDVRLAALHVLDRRWGPPREAADTIRRIAFGDDDSEVRDMAILVFANCFRNTNDAEVGRMLAGIVYDETRPRGFRVAAYRGLSLVRGILDPSRMIFRLVNDQFDIDWEFVDSFLKD